MTTKANINDMIFKTLKTKADKPARYAEQLRELGYKVENMEKGYNGNMCEREYWAVDGIEFFMPDNGPISVSLRNEFCERLDRIKLIDFVGYFEKREARKEKAERMKAHDNIEQTRDCYRVKISHYVSETGEVSRWYRWGWREVVERKRHHVYYDYNHTIIKYKRIKRDSEGYGWYSSSKTEEEYAREDIERAEKAIAAAMEQLKRAQERLAEAQVEQVKGSAELDAFLKAHGVRK